MNDLQDYSTKMSRIKIPKYDRSFSRRKYKVHIAKRLNRVKNTIAKFTTKRCSRSEKKRTGVNEAYKRKRSLQA